MAFDVNVVVISGRLGADPKMRYTQEGTAVTNFSMAVGLGREKTLWMPVTVWGKQAENANQYLTKGSEATVVGRLTQEEWATEDGGRKKRISVVANTVRFGAKPSTGESSEKPAAPKQGVYVPTDEDDGMEFPFGGSE